MQNLLPLEEKKKVVAEYHLRLWVVAVFAVTILVMTSLALLAPSYILALSKSNFVSDELVKLESMETSATQEKNVDAKTIEINKKTSLFLKREDASLSVPSKLLVRIIDTKTAAIKITGFSYDVTPVREQVVLMGHADDRDSLAQFLDALKKDGTFTKVELPISSYVKSSNIEFSLALERTLATPAQKK